MIYGRNGLDERVILADNRAARDLMFVLADCNVEGVVPELVCQRLEQLLHIDGKALLSEIEASEKAAAQADIDQAGHSGGCLGAC